MNILVNKHNFSALAGARRMPVVAILGILLGMAPASDAALRLWTGAGPNAFWSTAANWNPAGLPQDGDDLGFLAGMPRQTSTNDLAGRTFHSFIFNGAGAKYTLFGNDVTLVTGANALGGADGSLNFGIVTLAAKQEFVADGAKFNVSSDVALNGHTLTLRATTSNSIASVIGSIRGVGDVIKIGVGQGLFGGSKGNTYQGTLYVTEGIMLLGKGNVGNGLAVPGDLEIGSSVGDSDPFIDGKVVLLRANMITNTGTITINHGSLNQNGFDLTVGPLRLYDGGISSSNATLIPTATISQPAWPYTRYPFLSGHVSLPFDITFDLRAPGPLGIGAIVSGAGGIIQHGYGTLELRNTNSFTGAVEQRLSRLSFAVGQPSRWRPTLRFQRRHYIARSAEREVFCEQFGRGAAAILPVNEMMYASMVEGAPRRLEPRPWRRNPTCLQRSILR